MLKQIKLLNIVIIISLLLITLLNCSGGKEDYVAIKKSPTIANEVVITDYPKPFEFSWTAATGGVDSYEIWANGITIVSGIKPTENKYLYDPSKEKVKLNYSPIPYRWHVKAKNEFEYSPSNVGNLWIKDAIAPSCAFTNLVEGGRYPNPLELKISTEDKELGIYQIKIQIDDETPKTIFGNSAGEYSGKKYEGSYTVTEDIAGGEHTITLIVVDPAQNECEQKVNILVVPNTPHCVCTTKPICTIHPVLKWEKVNGADYYEMEVTTKSDTGYTNTIESCMKSNSCNLLDGETNTTYSVQTELIVGETYCFRVRAVSKSKAGIVLEGNWSETCLVNEDYTKENESCCMKIAGDNQVTLNQPCGTCYLYTVPEFSWYEVKGAKDYKLEIASDSDFSNIVFTKAGITTTTFTPDPGSVKGHLWWRVTSTGVAGAAECEGMPSEPCSFCIYTFPCENAVKTTQKLYQPAGVWVYNNGESTRVFVSDETTRNFRIYEFDGDDITRPGSTWGSGLHFGNVREINGITVDPETDLLYLSTSNSVRTGASTSPPLRGDILEFNIETREHIRTFNIEPTFNSATFGIVRPGGLWWGNKKLWWSDQPGTGTEQVDDAHGCNVPKTGVDLQGNCDITLDSDSGSTYNDHFSSGIGGNLHPDVMEVYAELVPVNNTTFVLSEIEIQAHDVITGNLKYRFAKGEISNPTGIWGVSMCCEGPCSHYVIVADITQHKIMFFEIEPGVSGKKVGEIDCVGNWPYEIAMDHITSDLYWVDAITDGSLYKIPLEPSADTCTLKAQKYY